MTPEEVFSLLNEMLPEGNCLSELDLQWLQDHPASYRIDSDLVSSLTESYMEEELFAIAYQEAKSRSYPVCIVQEGEEVTNPSDFNFCLPALFIKETPNDNPTVSVYIPLPF